jgi:hypothetical protein
MRTGRTVTIDRTGDLFASTNIRTVNHENIVFRTPAELFLAAQGINNINQGEDYGEERVCYVCNKRHTRGFPVYHRNSERGLVGDNYADYANLIKTPNDAVNQYYACPECKFLFQGNKYRNVGGFFVWHGKKSRGVIELSKDNKKQFLEIMLNLPEGWFFYALNRSFSRKYPSGNPAHFLHLAVLNYNHNGCNKYIATAYEETFIVDIEFLKRYVDLATKHEIISFGDFMRVNALKKHEGKIEVVTRLGMQKIISNIRAVEVVNRLIR